MACNASAAIRRLLYEISSSEILSDSLSSAIAVVEGQARRFQITLKLRGNPNQNVANELHTLSFLSLTKGPYENRLK
jgi:hypothetical protein